MPFLGIICFGGCLWLYILMVLENDQALDLVFFHVFTFSLSEGRATLFYGVLASGAFMLFFLSWILFLKAMISKATIRIEAGHLHIPKGIFGKTQIISVENIVFFQLNQLGVKRSLIIHHANGRAFINESLLPQKACLDEIYEILCKK